MSARPPVVLAHGGDLYLKHPHVARYVLALPGSTLVRADVARAPDTEGVRHWLAEMFVPAPAAELTDDYHWPGEHRPLEHQLRTVEFLMNHKRCLVLNDMGTGKTVTALWAFDRLRRAGKVKRALVIAPKSTLDFTWGQAIFRTLHAEGVRYEILRAPGAKRREKIKGDQDIDVLNHGIEAFRSVAGEAVGRYDLLIVDEASTYRNATKTWREFRAWLALHRDIRVWGMTGTPTPNRPADAWVLSAMIGSRYAQKSWYAARDNLEYKPSQEGFRWLPQNGAQAAVQRMLQPSIRYKLTDCVGLPETTVQDRTVELTTQQKKLYGEMRKDLIAEVEAGRITAANGAVKLMRLIQICAGAGYVENEEELGTTARPLDCKPRVDEAVSLIEECGGKAIVFVPYVGVLRHVAAILADHFETAIVYGATPAGRRAEVFKAFQDGATPRVLVAIPQVMSHGLTLTAARAIVWWSPIPSNETYTQACARVDRIGKRHPCSVVHLISSPVERAMYAALRGRQDTQEAILAALTQAA